MGEVWKADHMLLARTAAIKLIRTDLDGRITAAHLQRFEREVQATAGLHSPHTIDVYDYGLTSDGTFYYVMELLDVRLRSGQLDPLQFIACRILQSRRPTAPVLSCWSAGELHLQG
jgi:serine/threonine protein kinase